VPAAPEDLRGHACVRFTALTPGTDWQFLAGRRPVSVAVATRFATNQVDAAIAACEQGLGPGMFLSYQVAEAVAARRLRYVLAGFERDPVPVNVIYPQSRLRSSAVRAFVDLAATTLRATRFD
jgi:DNA-binding transcriptional LysR family regulator